MARRARELGALAVERLRKPGLYAVGGVAGLYLQVLADRNTGKPTGARTWIYRYLSPTLTYTKGENIGKKARRDLGLGAYSQSGRNLAIARTDALEAQNLVKQGIDPIDHGREVASKTATENAKALTFKEAAEQYIKTHHRSWSEGNQSQWEGNLSDYAYPKIGHLLVKHIDTREVLSVLSPIWDDMTPTASRLRGRIESVLDWATAHKYRDGVNPARWRGNLKNLLADPRKPKEHHPALPIERMGAFMQTLRQRDGMSDKALLFCVLTAARSSEVLGADWREVDLDAGTWTIPGSRMKSGKDHRVALSKPAIEILNAMPERSGLLFPGREGELAHNALLGALTRMNKPTALWIDKHGKPVTVHGFRASFRTWAAEKTSFPREVIEQCLAHAVAGEVELAYMRSDVIDKRRRLMQQWADFCAKPYVKPEAKGKVVDFPKQA